MTSDRSLFGVVFVKSEKKNVEQTKIPPTGFEPVIFSV